jgi:transaldolase
LWASTGTKNPAYSDGVDLERVTARLLEEGIDKFVAPYDALLQSLKTARLAALA